MWVLKRWLVGSKEGERMTVKSWSSEKKNDGCGRQGRNDRNERLSLDWCEEEKEKRRKAGNRWAVTLYIRLEPSVLLIGGFPRSCFPGQWAQIRGKTQDKGTIIALTISINISRLLWAI